jgi:hypothetical protein
MNGSNGNGKRVAASSGPPLVEASCQHASTALHPAWAAFIRLCQEIEFGELERVKLQNGLPVSVEVVKRKIKVV